MEDLKTSLLIKQQLPEFVREDYPLFSSFLEAYYEFLETKQTGQNNDLVTVSKKIRNIGDVDISLDDFEEQFLNTFASLLPKDTEVDKEFLLKNILPLYQSKGSEQSFKLLFRLLFNEDVEVYYPKNNILIASSGKWKIPKTLKVNTEIHSFYYGDGETREFKILGESGTDEITIYIDGVLQTSGYYTYKQYKLLILEEALPQDSLLEVYYSNIVSPISSYNREIVGETSGSRAIIEKTYSRILNNKMIYELYLDDKTVTGDFITGETAICIPIIDGIPVNVRVSTVSELDKIIIVDGGSNYNVGDPVIINAPNAEVPPRAVVSRVVRTNIEQVDIISGAAGFQIGCNVYVEGYGYPYIDANVNSILIDSGNSANIFIATTDVIDDIDPSNTTIDSLTYGLSNLTGNLNTKISEALTKVSFENLGEIIGIDFRSSQILITTSRNIDVEPAKIVVEPTGYRTSNTTLFINRYGSLGRLVVNHGGLNYNLYDEIEFINTDTYYGLGAEAEVISVDSSGTILDVDFVPSKIRGTVNVSNTSITVVGNDTIFTEDLVVGSNIRVYGNDKTVTEIISNTSINVDSVFSESVNEKPIRLYGKYLIGGQGYDLNYLPTANVISDTGTGANVVVTCIMGDGEVLEAKTGDKIPGSIERISIIDPGRKLLIEPEIDLTGYGDGKAKAISTIVPSYDSLDGLWTSPEGLLSSSDNKLQGLDYYINYSYILKSKLEFRKYKEALFNLLHPAGSKSYYEMYRESEITSSSVSVETLDFETYSTNDYGTVVTFTVVEEDYGLITEEIDEEDDYGTLE